VVAALAAESNVNINNHRHQLIVRIQRQHLHPTKEALRIVQPVNCVRRTFQLL